MLGGYYLGQIYLGDSGYSQQLTLEVDSATHTVSSDSNNLIQIFYLIADNTSHSNTADILSLQQYMTLNKPDDSFIHNNATTVILVEYKTLEPMDSRHSVTSSDILKIINWTELGVDFGRYIKDFNESGTINQETIESGILNKKYNNIGSFGQVILDEDGNYDIKYNNKGIF